MKSDENFARPVVFQGPFATPFFVRAIKYCYLNYSSQPENSNWTVDHSSYLSCTGVFFRICTKWVKMKFRDSRHGRGEYGFTKKFAANTKGTEYYSFHNPQVFICDIQLDLACVSRRQKAEREEFGARVETARCAKGWLCPRAKSSLP